MAQLASGNVLVSSVFGKTCSSSVKTSLLKVEEAGKPKTEADGFRIAQSYLLFSCFECGAVAG